MSGPLAVAGVTAVLTETLQTWLDEQSINGALGGATASVTAEAPDTVVLTGPNAAPKLNFFLHQVSLNPGWRNAGLPSRDARGSRIGAPPLGLDLHYLLTAYGPAPLQAEVLLGYGMQFLHERPVLDRASIIDGLPNSLRASHLAQQVEQIKVTPEGMTSEELSKLWSALQAKYRPTAPYQVSVVLVESEGDGRVALPVLGVGHVDPGTGRHRGVVAATGVGPTLPGITAVRPPGDQPGAQLGDVVVVDGHHLDGTNRVVLVDNAALDLHREISAQAGTQHDRVSFTLPNQPAALAVGTHALRVRLDRPGETVPRETNQLALTIVPRITTALPLTVARDGGGTATVDLGVRPNVRPHQSAALVVGGLVVPAEPHPNPTNSLQFVIEDAPAGTHLIRVRVDGVDSLIVDRTSDPPQFLDRRLEIT